MYTFLDQFLSRGAAGQSLGLGNQELECKNAIMWVLQLYQKYFARSS